MKIYSIQDPEFAPYGKVLEGYDTEPLVAALEQATPLPQGVEYVPSQPELEALPIAKTLASNAYGGMPIQMGWCNGHNTKLNCLEYHRDSEMNCGTCDFILLVAREDEIANGKLDSAKVKAFLVPAGTLVEVYATTLHYAPCHVKEDGFQVAIVLPRGTNYPLKGSHVKVEDAQCGAGVSNEDAMLTAVNKWLIGHAEGGLDAGSFLGLKGKNLCLTED